MHKYIYICVHCDESQLILILTLTKIVYAFKYYSPWPSLTYTITNKLAKAFKRFNKIKHELTEANIN